MTDKRYTLTLTGEQLYALKSAFDANFGSGFDEGEASKTERQVSAKLDRLHMKHNNDRRHARAMDYKPRMSPENQARALRNVTAGRRAGDDGE